MAKTTSKTFARPKPTASAKAAAKDSAPGAAKSGSKATTIIALLRRENGATLEEMMDATGWQKHSVRGFMAGALKKQHGLTAGSEKTDKGRVYHVAAEVQQ